MTPKNIGIILEMPQIEDNELNKEDLEELVQ